MKWIFAFALLLTAPLTFAQAPTTAPAPTAAATVTPAPATPPPIVAPTVTMPQNVAPPQWATEFLQIVSNLPIVGPYISKAVMYLGILGSLLTAFVLFLNAVAASLKGVVNFAGLTNLVTLLQNFQQSKIMYWLTAFSNIPVNSTPAKAGAPAPKATT